MAWRPLLLAADFFLSFATLEAARAVGVATFDTPRAYATRFPSYPTLTLRISSKAVHELK